LGLSSAGAGFPPIEVEVAQTPEEENDAVNVNVVAETSLGAQDITVSIPSNATIVRVLAMARISIMNNTATAQKIDLRLDVEGVTLFDQDDVVGFPAADGASATYTIVEDATDEVTSNGQEVTLEAFATLSAAASVRFQVEYFLFITYRLS
jgi:hypothetical protein